MWLNATGRALAGFEFRRAIARPGVRLALILFVAGLGIGHYEFWTKGEPATLYVEASCVALIGILCFGLAEDRRRAFDQYLIRNHFDARTYVRAKAVAMVGLVLVGGLVAFVTKLAFSGGNLSESLWLGALTTTLGFMVAPVAMLLEGYIDTSMPAAFVVLGYPLLTVLVFLTTESLAPFELLGIRGIVNGRLETLGPMAVRAAIGVVPAFLLAGALIELRLRRY